MKLASENSWEESECFFASTVNFCEVTTVRLYKHMHKFSDKTVNDKICNIKNKGNNKITELRTILHKLSCSDQVDCNGRRTSKFT